MNAGRVVINPLTYAEVSVGYQTVEELNEPLPASERSHLAVSVTQEVGVLAGCEVVADLVGFWRAQPSVKVHR